MSVFDRYDESAMFTVRNANGELLGHFGAKDAFALTKSGTYTVEAVNRFGKSKIFTLSISRDAPKVQIGENSEKKRLEVFVTASTDELAHLDDVEIYKSTDNGETWELLGKDDYGNIISADTLSYAFCTSGLYKVVAIDEFRTGIDAVTKEYEYTQAAPEGTLSGVENDGYTNGSVAFTWTDEAIVTLERGGERLEYKSGEKLTEDGAYTLTFENRDGYKKVYSFVIDTVAPEVTLSGARNHGAVTSDLKLSFTDESATAELFRNGKSLGAYESETVVSESGAYKIVVIDLANNKTEVDFTIDKFVDYAINVNDKGIADSVTVTANEDVTAALTKDGETVEYTVGETITQAGEYVLTLTDDLDNSAQISFTVVEPFVTRFSHNFDDMPNFERVVIDGEEKRLNYGTLELFEDGVYEVCVVAGGETYTFTVTVDGTAPTLALVGVENGGSTKKGVTLSEPSEDAEVKVFRNGTETAYELGGTLTKAGQYRVTVTDKCGNVTEYSFRIQKGLSGGIIALIVIGCVLLLGGAATVLVLKKKNVF